MPLIMMPVTHCYITYDIYIPAEDWWKSEQA